MTPNIPALRYSCAALAAAGALVGALTIPAGTAAAQTTYQTYQTYQTYPAYQTREEITVTPPYVEHRPLGRSYSGIPIEELSLSRAVDYSDLNLSRWQDVQMLDYRVRQAAYAACGELNRQYPESLYPSYQSDDRDCVARATNEGMAQARWAVANWNGAPPAYYGPPPYYRQ